MIEPEQVSPEEEIQSRARRRRTRRRVIAPLTPDEKSDYIEAVLRKASPSFDFFLFSLLAGAILGVGFIFDSPYLLLLGTLLAPLMSPVVGISLGTVLGSTRYFGRSLGGLLVGCFLVTLVGGLSGLASRILPSEELIQVHTFAQLNWTAFIAVGIGAVAANATLVREKSYPGIPSLAVAFSLYLPLSAAGFGLGSGIPHLWPDGLVLFAIHLAWATLLGAITLAIMGFRPYTLFGYSIGGVVALVMIILMIAFFGIGAVIGEGITLPTPTLTLTPSLTPSQTPTSTPIPPTATYTPTLTPTFTLTPTKTHTLTPTPVQAIVDVKGYAVLRDAPNGGLVARLLNGSLVELLGDSEVDEHGGTWLHVYSPEHNVEGWILQSLLVIPTPLEITPTPTPQPPTTQTPSPPASP